MIVFRVDSSSQIGSGHLMRCLTLAGQLKNKTDIIFISRDLDGNLNKLIEKNGYRLLTLPKILENNNLSGYEKWLTVKKQFDAEQTKNLLTVLDVGCLIIDSYAIDEEWEDIVRPYVKKIMVIDDLANRRHNCDILLDQNYYCDMNTRYNKLVPVGCQLLLGPRYALLREEFYEARQKMRVRDEEIKNILVFFGGSDLTNETMKALQAIEKMNRLDITINIVVGASSKSKYEVEEFCKKNENMHYFYQVNNMAELMHKADLAIGAGGTTTWERCFLGLPAIVIAIADNQIKISEDCDQLGIIKYIGYAKDVTIETIKDNLDKILYKSEMKRVMTRLSEFSCTMNKERLYEYLFCEY